MTVQAITEQAVRKGLIAPRGGTPAATMRAALYTYVRDTASPAVHRDFRPGPTRAARDSVKWRYIG
jgi:hypothetical protein